MDKTEVVDKVKQYKLLLMDYFDIEKVYLFGSYARSTNREDSDIDVAIIVKSIKGDFFSTTPLLWKIRRQIDDRIEPILLERENDKGGFIDEIQKYGIEIV